MTTERTRRPTTQSEPNRISHVFWRLADVELGSVIRDPEWVVKTWLAAVDGLEGRRGDRQTAQIALSFLMRLEQDPFYASPEQTRGGEKDSSGLVYSLALLLFERLTGHHPFVESLSPLECRIQRDRAKRVGKNNLCHLSSRLRVILNKALSPFAEDRYPSVAAFRADVESWYRGDTATSSQSTRMPARRATQPPPPPRPAKPFVESDTLQGAVSIGSPSASATPASSRAPAPWMWPSISAGFALVAVVALFVAVRSNRQPQGKTTHRAAASVASSSVALPPALPVTLASAVPAKADNVIMVFDEEEAIEKEAATAEQQIVTVLRSCVANAKFRGGLDLGLSLLFDAEGKATRSFTGKLPIAAAEAACIKSALTDVSTDDPASLGKMVRYDLYMSIESERVRSHPAR